MILVCPECKHRHEACACPASIRRLPLVPAGIPKPTRAFPTIPTEKRL